MKRIIDTSEALGTVEAPEGLCELCASADAIFDEEAGHLVVNLDSYLRPTGLLAKERHFRAGWLPENETITESVALEECRDMAREIFHRWAHKVREASSRRKRSIASASRHESASRQSLDPPAPGVGI